MVLGTKVAYFSLTLFAFCFLLNVLACKKEKKKNVGSVNTTNMRL
jgi:hypothetical protein